MNDNIEGLKILVISSSEALPRLEPEFCSYDDSWPGLLRKSAYVYQVSVGGLTIDVLMTQIKTYHRVFQPDVLVIQAGINDCVPRALKKVELAILDKLPFGKWFLKNVVKKYSYRIRKWRNITYTKPEDYRRHMLSLKSFFPNAFIMPISILHPLPAHERKVPGLTDRVEEYNQILKDLYPKGYVSIRDIAHEGVMSDFIHFNKEGHAYIHDAVLKVIRENASLIRNLEKLNVL